MRSDPLAYLAAELETLKAQGLYRRLRVLEDEQKAKTTVDHRVVVNLSSNNYLGLTTHPRLRQAALEGVERYGVGTGSVRTIAGTMVVAGLVLLLARRFANPRVRLATTAMDKVLFAVMALTLHLLATPAAVRRTAVW